MDELLIYKVLSLFAILLFSILFGVAPIWIEKLVRLPKVRWVNNAIISFSGGTLLGIAFLHLMPETRESLENIKQRKGYLDNFPPNVSLADTIICGGFFFIYLLDETIHLLLEWLGNENKHQPHGRLSIDLEHLGLRSSKDEATSTVDIEEGRVCTVRRPAIHIPGILTIIALSFHDIFEGLALGIQEHSMDVLFMFVSVATHKYAIAFAVSLDFLLSGVQAKMIVVYTICFSIVNPLGIAFGIFTSYIGTENGNFETPTTVLMQGISCGSLIYVTCFEVLQRHTSGDGSHLTGIRNTLFVILGFLFILLLKMYMPHNHLEHGHLEHGQGHH